MWSARPNMYAVLRPTQSDNYVFNGIDFAFSIGRTTNLTDARAKYFVKNVIKCVFNRLLYINYHC